MAGVALSGCTTSEDNCESPKATPTATAEVKKDSGGSLALTPEQRAEVSAIARQTALMQIDITLGESRGVDSKGSFVVDSTFNTNDSWLIYSSSSIEVNNKPYDSENFPHSIHITLKQVGDGIELNMRRTTDNICFDTQSSEVVNCDSRSLTRENWKFFTENEEFFTDDSKPTEENVRKMLASSDTMFIAGSKSHEYTDGDSKEFDVKLVEVNIDESGEVKSAGSSTLQQDLIDIINN